MITMKFDDAKLKINGMQELGIRQAYTDDMPLAEATGFEPGGLHRFDIAVSGYFTKAIDGIMFKRDFRLELRGANGTGALQIEVVAVTHALQQLQGTGYGYLWIAPQGEMAYMAWEQAIDEEIWDEEHEEDPNDTLAYRQLKAEAKRRRLDLSLPMPWRIATMDDFT